MGLRLAIVMAEVSSLPCHYSRRTGLEFPSVAPTKWPWIVRRWVDGEHSGSLILVLPCPWPATSSLCPWHATLSLCHFFHSLWWQLVQHWSWSLSLCFCCLIIACYAMLENVVCMPHYHGKETCWKMFSKIGLIQILLTWKILGGSLGIERKRIVGHQEHPTMHCNGPVTYKAEECNLQ